MSNVINHARRFLSTRLLERAQPVYHINGALVPAHSMNQVLVDWSPNWKSQIIAETLAERTGLLIDVGANIGQTLLDYCAASQRHGYIGFEPNPRCAGMVEDIIGRSGLVDCAVVPIGLSDAHGVVKLYAFGASDSSATMVEGIRPNKDAMQLFVPVFRFDDVWPSIGGDRPIALIKIDVEGAEVDVLAGMAETVLSHRPRIICEFLHRHPSVSPAKHRQRAEALYEIVKSCGYRVARIEKSPGERSAIGFTPISAFPLEVYDLVTNGHSCDYLFEHTGSES